MGYKSVFVALGCLLVAGISFADTGFPSSINIKETDGSPMCQAGQIQVSPGTLICTGNVATITTGGGSTALSSTQTWTGQNNWTTPSQSTFTYGVTVGSLSTTGNGNLSVTENGITGQVVLSTAGTGVTIGHCAQFGSSMTVVDAGAACSTGGGTPGGSPSQLQYNNGGTFGGASSVVTASSLTIISSMSVTNNGTQNASPGLLDVYKSNAASGNPLLTVGSQNQNSQFVIQDQLPVDLSRYGLISGGLNIGQNSHTQEITSNQEVDNTVNLWNSGEMDLQTATTANGGGNIVLKPGKVSEVVVSTLGVTVSTSVTIVNSSLTVTTALIAGVSGSTISYSSATLNNASVPGTLALGNLQTFGLGSSAGLNIYTTRIIDVGANAVDSGWTNSSITGFYWKNDTTGETLMNLQTAPDNGLGSHHGELDVLYGFHSGTASVTGLLTTGSMTVTGSGSGVGGTSDLTEGTAPSGITGHDLIYGDASANWPKFIPNNNAAGPFYMVGSSGSLTLFDLLAASGQGSLVDSKIPASSVVFYNSTGTFTSSQTITSPSGFLVKYNINVGSMTGAGLTDCTGAGKATTWASATGLYGCNSGFITGNQSISITGDSSGSGTTAITLTAAASQPNIATLSHAVTHTSSVTVTAAGGLGVTYAVTAASVSVSTNSYIAGSTFTFQVGGQLSIKQINWADGTVQVSSPPAAGTGSGVTVYPASATASFPYGASFSTSVYTSAIPIKFNSVGLQNQTFLGTDINGNLQASSLPSDVVLNDSASKATFTSSITANGNGGVGIQFGVTAATGTFSTGLNIPNGSNPTLSNTGDIGLDTTTGQLLIYDGVSTKVIAQSTHSFTVSISSGIGWNGLAIPVWRAPDNESITITKIIAESLPAGTTVLYQLDYRGVGTINTTGTSLFSVAYSSAPDNSLTTTSFASSDIPTDNTLVLTTPAANAGKGTPTYMTFTAYYLLDRK